MGTVTQHSQSNRAVLLLVWLVVGLCLLAAGWLTVAHPDQQASAKPFRLETTAFTSGGNILQRFTCQGADVSPALTWTDPPAGTKSFVLIVDDPDAPGGTFVHWVVYDLPAKARRLAEAIPGNEEMSGGGRQGVNDFPMSGYGGPCPPPGKYHRYYFRLYALDTALNLKGGATRQEVDRAMKGHVLAEAEVMGRFRR